MGCCCSKLGVAWAMSLGGAGVVGMLIAGGAGQAGGQPEEESNAEMDAWKEKGQPNEHHQALQAMAGDFNVEMWFQMGPDGPKQESKGEARSEWLLGGRYLGTHFTTEVMGDPFEGHAIMGYDNINEHYFSGWIDNMSTGLFTEKGQMSDDGKTFTLKGSMNTPAGVKMTTKHIYTIYSDDKYTMEFWEAPEGEDLVNTSVITLTRM